MRIAFRVDAGHRLGLGHLMRCLTLADQLRAHGAHCQFVCRQQTGLAGSLVRDHPLSLLPAPDGQALDDLPHAAWLGVSQAQDAADTLKALEGSPVDWLVTDHYGLDARWHRALRPQAGRILAIDDLADREQAADLLLDQNLGRAAADYDGLVPATCQRLIGLQFALLREEFSRWRPTSLQRQRHRLQHLMISLGGVDADNASGRVLQALAACALPDIEAITLVLGPAAPHREALETLLERYPHPVNLQVGINNMAERLATTDLVIGAAGSSAWERCCLGVPSLMLVLAENQVPLARALAEQGAALTLPAAQDPGFDAALGAILDRATAALPAMQDQAAALLDGRGAARVAAAMGGA